MKLWTLNIFLSWLLFLNLTLLYECGATRRTGRSKRDLLRQRDASRPFQGACGTRLPRGKRSIPGMDRRLPRQHHRSSQPEESTLSRGKAVYFTGKGDQLRLKPGTEIPKGKFTLEMWIKPEGGQKSPAVIAGTWLLLLHFEEIYWRMNNIIKSGVAKSFAAFSAFFKAQNMILHSYLLGL
ncbi:PAPP1 protein, partial [Polypterus senegalus]